MIGDSANTPVKQKPEFMRNFSSKTVNKREKSSQKFSVSEFIWGPDRGGGWEMGHREFKPILQLSTPYVFIFYIHSLSRCICRLFNPTRCVNFIFAWKFSLWNSDSKSVTIMFLYTLIITELSSGISRRRWSVQYDEIIREEDLVETVGYLTVRHGLS